MERPHSVHIAGNPPPPKKTLLGSGDNPEKGGEGLLHLLCVEGKSKVSFITLYYTLFSLWS